MRHCAHWLVFWLLPIVVSAAVAGVADQEREARLAAQIEDAILDGEPLYLKSPHGDFLTLYTKAENPRGTVLLMHGRGFHPDWHSVIQPLRVGLVEHGWNTLSIQLPVLAKKAKYRDYLEVFPEAIPRIESALDFIQRQGTGMTVVLAHSCGVHMAQHWIHERGKQATSRIDAFIGIGMGATDYRQSMVEPFVLDKLSVPVLDVFGEKDFSAVRRMAPQRLAQIRKSANPKSSQRVVPGANHYFEDRGEALTGLIAGWLDTL